MNYFSNLKFFAIKLTILLLVAPVAGFYFLKFVDLIEEAWKSNNRKKKWVVMSAVFAIIASFAGWLR